MIQVYYRLPFIKTRRISTCIWWVGVGLYSGGRGARLQFAKCWEKKLKYW